MIHSAGSNPEVLAWLSLPGKLFLNLIKCIVAPLVFTMLVVGIGGASDLHSVGRMGLRTMSYFLVVTSLALLVGLAAVNLTHPGVGVNLPAEVDEGVRLISASAKKLTPQQHILNIVPTSIVKAAAENEVLQLVVFSLMFAVAVLKLGAKGKPVIVLCQSIADAMFIFTGFVMKLAPLAVCTAIAETVGRSGFGVLGNLAVLVGTLYGALIAFSCWCCCRSLCGSSCRSGGSSRWCVNRRCWPLLRPQASRHCQWRWKTWSGLACRAAW